MVATCYLLGVTTRRMDKLVRSLGITGLSRSQVSEMAKDLDAQVEAFRARPLDAGPYTFVAADALTMKVREGGRVVKIAVLVATGVNADGYREILGVHTATTESGAGWLGSFRDLVAHGSPRRVRSGWSGLTPGSWTRWWIMPLTGALRRDRSRGRPVLYRMSHRAIRRRASPWPGR